MTHFPRKARDRATPPPPLLGSVKQALAGDLLWGRPVFKAPHLPNPRVAFDPLPFTSTRFRRPSR
ncbi:MAG: hypothetical protein PHQ04_05250 [Opitutaceae bacterium]|nr:hypothetical protein [Opitutaceae bacterium]